MGSGQERNPGVPVSPFLNMGHMVPFVLKPNWAKTALSKVVLRPARPVSQILNKGHMMPFAPMKPNSAYTALITAALRPARPII